MAFSNSNDQPTCPICLDDFRTEKPLNLKCGHTMHLPCIRKYINRSLGVNCPLCRGKIELTESIVKDPVQNINCILTHQKCSGHTKKGNRCRYRSYPGNMGFCRVHHPSGFSSIDIQYLSWLLTQEFRVNFHCKVALYDLFLAAKDRYKNRYVKDGGGAFYEDYQTCLEDTTHYKHIYDRFNLPYPGDDYFLNMAKALFDCSDLSGP